MISVYAPTTSSDQPPVRLLDGVVFVHITIPAVYGLRVAVANCFDLSSADFTGVDVATCADAGSVCLPPYCDDTAAEVGVACYCDGGSRDAIDCASSAQMQVFVYYPC